MTVYGEQPHYLGLSGNHKGLFQGGIFHKFQLVEGKPHCLIIYRDEIKKKARKENYYLFI